jgi:outer membrane biosynthesis protein TonB
VSQAGTIAMDETWRRPDRPLTASLAASVAFHIALLALAGLALRPLPASLVRTEGAAAPLHALMVAVESPEAPRARAPVVPEPPLPMPLPPIVAPPVHGMARGLSMSPARIAADPEFIEAGHISVGASVNTRDFPPDVLALLAERFPYRPARLPRLVAGVRAQYPLKAARDGVSQRIRVLLLLDAAGNILEMQAAPEDPLFAAAVAAAIKNLQLTPAEFDGKPVPYWAILDFKFDIDGPTGADGKRLN